MRLTVDVPYPELAQHRQASPELIDGVFAHRVLVAHDETAYQFRLVFATLASGPE